MGAAAQTGGMDEGTITDFASKGADKRFIAAAFAARDKLPLDVGGRQINALIGAVRRDDGHGNIAPELAAAGVTAEMDPYARVQQLFRAHSAGTINDAQFYTAVGGQSTEAFVRAITPIMTQPGGVEQSLAGLMAPDLAEGEIAKKRQNPDYRRYERMSRTQLMVWAEKYKGKFSDQGEALAHADAQLEADGVPTWIRKLGDWTGLKGVHAMGVDEATLEKRSPGDLERIYNSTGRDKEIEEGVEMRRLKTADEVQQELRDGRAGIAPPSGLIGPMVNPLTIPSILGGPGGVFIQNIYNHSNVRTDKPSAMPSFPVQE